MTHDMPHRSLLFVPALRPDRFEKAERSGADLMCVDLEDAVPPGRKQEGRVAALPYFAQARAPEGARRFLRLNSPRTPDGLRDLLAVCEAIPGPDGVVIPKVESAEEIRWVEEILAPRHPAIEIIPLIESPAGLARVGAIAGASGRVGALAFGYVDYAALTGSRLDWQSLLYARGRLVAAAATNGLDTMDGTWLDLDDEAGLREEATHAAALGCTGKLAIHPRQVGPIHETFTPSSPAIAHARRIVEAFERTPDGVLVIDGRLVDEPVVKLARRTLAIARRDVRHDTPSPDQSQ